MNGLKIGTKSSWNARSIIEKENAFLNAFAKYAEVHSAEDVKLLAAELVIRQYVRDVLDILVERASLIKDKDDHRAQNLLAAMDKNFCDGTRGLWAGAIRTILGYVPNVVSLRPRDGVTTSNGNQATFVGYNDGSWVGRIKALFCWDDDLDKPRLWENAKYRVLRARLYAVMTKHLTVSQLDTFEPTLISVAARKLLILPHFDREKLSIMSKAYVGHSRETQAAIRETSQLDRTNWIMPTFPDQEANPLLWDSIQNCLKYLWDKKALALAMEVMSDRMIPQTLWDEAPVRAQQSRALPARAVRRMNLKVVHSGNEVKDRTFFLLAYPQEIQISTGLGRASAFIDQVLLDAESDSGSDDERESAATDSGAASDTTEEWSSDGSGTE